MGSDLVASAKASLTAKMNEIEHEVSDLNKELAAVALEIEQEAAAQNKSGFKHLKELLAQIDERKDDYLFRSSLNQTMARAIERIEFQEPLEYEPWELSEDDDVVKEYRKVNDKRRRQPLDEILGSSFFERYWRDYERTVIVRYRSGASRYIWFGQDISMPYGGPLKIQIPV